MSNQIIIKIEGLEELTKAVIVLAGSIQDHTALMEKSGSTIEIKGGPCIIDFNKISEDMKAKEIDQEPEADVELAVRDMYYFNKAKNSMIMIKKGQPLEVAVGYKATTKAKYDEFFGEDNDPVPTPGDDQEYTPADEVDVPWKVDGEDEAITMEDLRAQLVALGKAKGKEAAKKIISDLGAAQLTELDPGLYGEAMATAKALLGK